MNIVIFFKNKNVCYVPVYDKGQYVGFTIIRSIRGV
jgi:hypothetical protein